MNMIRVILPQHLRTLAHVGSEVTVDVQGQTTLRSVLDALEARYPMLRGTIRDHVTLERRPFLRFFACEEDLSHEPPDSPLSQCVIGVALVATHTQFPFLRIQVSTKRSLRT